MQILTTSNQIFHFRISCKETMAAAHEASRSVLTSEDLFRLLTVYQRGIWEDLLPFLPLQQLIACKRSKEARFIFSRHVEVVHPWYISHGLERLERLVTELPWAAKLVFIYGIYVGDKNIVMAPALELYRCKTTYMTSLVDAAVASDNDIGAIECLKCLGLNSCDVFVGVGDALARGRRMLAEYLADKFEAIYADQNASWIESSVQRSHMQDNLQEIFCSSRLERLPWLLDFWDRWLPQRWSGRCRQECRYLAMEHQQWDLLIDFTKSVPEPHLRYKEDMVYAAQHSLLDAVEWLVENTSVVVDHTHVIEAAKAWRPNDKASHATFNRLLSLWLFLEDSIEKQRRVVEQCMAEALKRDYLDFMQLLWSTNILPYRQTWFTIPKPNSIVEFIALDLLHSHELQSLGPKVSAKVKQAYREAAMSIAWESDSVGNPIHDFPVKIRATHRPGEPPKYAKMY
ncbi:hypothetical protein AeRB84_012047 [Aphanomyces euteiches]|nr:hypothetical protein AeRB84_012047 [Aphanomyces euteiches]